MDVQSAYTTEFLDGPESAQSGWSFGNKDEHGHGQG
jgi:hypothetical protein